MNNRTTPRSDGRLGLHGSGAAFADLSHEIVSGATAYPGLPQPELTSYLTHEQSRKSYDEGYQFQTSRLCMVGQTGTYLDTPLHAFPDGYDLSGLDLRRVAQVPACVVDTDEREISAACFARLGRRALEGRAVLIRTGWSRYWGTETYANGDHPHLTGEAARFLADAGPAVVGIDSLNIDDTRGRARPAHYAILGAGIPLVEHLTNLHELPTGGARFTAVPVPVAGMGTFPVRALASWSRWT
ncbi:cyclase family protein [Streptomyces sp. YIM 103828]|uniref:cyclase family protein n=1 Tax=Streptomyces sp. YIM 103828 TaxID=3158968 RepID=UPI0032D8CC1D